MVSHGALGGAGFFPSTVSPTAPNPLEPSRIFLKAAPNHPYRLSIWAYQPHSAVGKKYEILLYRPRLMAWLVQRTDPFANLSGKSSVSRKAFELGHLQFARFLLAKWENHHIANPIPLVEHQNSWYMGVHAPQNGGIGYDLWPCCSFAHPTQPVGSTIPDTVPVPPLRHLRRGGYRASLGAESIRSILLLHRRFPQKLSRKMCVLEVRMLTNVYIY